MEENAKKDGRRGIWNFLQLVSRLFIAPGYGYSCEQLTLDAPFLLVSNHVTDLDPFFVGMACKKTPLTFVASEHIARMGVVSKIIMKLLSPIPRAKAASGASTVKSCLRRIRAGEAIALFAEGDCTWDGLTAHIFPATGKLAKASGAPLVTFRLTGGHLINPRWAFKRRRGNMRGAAVRVYTAEELRSMTADEITEAIERDIAENAWERQRREMIPLRSRRAAEGLERAVCVCPECGAVASLASKNGEVFCKNEGCGFEASVDGFGFFKGEEPFPTVAEWDEWQKARLKEYLARGERVNDLEGEVRGRFTKLSGEETRGKYENASARLDFKSRSVIINGAAIGLSEIDNMSMVRANRLLFSTKDGYYELKCKSGCLRKFLLVWQAADGLEKGNTVL